MSSPAPEVSAPMRSAPILPVLAIGIGAYLLWFGVKYWKGSGAFVWPSTPIRSVLEGKGVPSNTPAAVTAVETLTAYEAQLASVASASTAKSVASAATGKSSGTSKGTGKGTGAAAGGGATASGGSSPGGGANANRGRLLAARRGWTGQQWTCLNELWGSMESGWNNRVWNGGSTAPTKPPGSSGAYGIPQALPYTKMPRAAWPPGYGGTADPTTQIEWGLGYIASRYGTPCAAVAFHRANGWY